MKKNNCIIKVIIAIFMLMLVVFPGAYATNFPNTSHATPILKVKNSADKVWGTVTTIFQILAFAAIVFAGLRYMFSSADERADIKSSLAVLVLGSILVFAASTVVKFVTNTANEVL